jgi:hypothetical protein
MYASSRVLRINTDLHPAILALNIPYYLTTSVITSTIKTRGCYNNLYKMPIKKYKTHHRVRREKHKRSKKFLKVYAPYIPILLMAGLGLFFSGGGQLKNSKNQDVLAYATDISSTGLLESTNQRRQSGGQPDLRLNEQLAKAAQAKASDMVSQDYWSHATPDGKQPWYFIEKSGYEYSKAAENLAYGFGGNDSAISGWMNSPQHRANILDGALKEVGFGIANSADYQNSGPQTIVAAIYAAPAEQNVQTAGTVNDSNNRFSVLAGEKKISYVQSATGGYAPWSGLLLGLVFAAAVMYLLLKHLRSVRRVLLQGERFIIKHPLLDASLAAFIALALVLSRTSGVIH